jgi:hypothetical protein
MKRYLHVTGEGATPNSNRIPDGTESRRRKLFKTESDLPKAGIISTTAWERLSGKVWFAPVICLVSRLSKKACFGNRSIDFSLREAGFDAPQIWSRSGVISGSCKMLIKNAASRTHWWPNAGSSLPYRKPTSYEIVMPLLSINQFKTSITIGN